jgi:uncharacterized membrane protein
MHNLQVARRWPGDHNASGTHPAAFQNMNTRRALKVVLGIAVFGLTFSGVLTYQELFGHSAAMCPSPGAPGTVFGYPACVYGFFMYLAVAGISVWGLLAEHRQRKQTQPALPGLAQPAMRGA